MRGRGKPKIVGDPGNEGWEIYELKAEGTSVEQEMYEGVFEEKDFIK